MVDTDKLIGASAAFNGSYNNGSGKDRFTIGEVIGRKSRANLLNQLGTVADALEAAKEKPEAEGRWGHRTVEAAGRAAFEQTGLDPIFVARICMSEIDPQLLTPEPLAGPGLQQDAQILLTSRRIAGEFHELAIIANDAD